MPVGGCSGEAWAPSHSIANPLRKGYGEHERLTPLPQETRLGDKISRI